MVDLSEENKGKQYGMAVEELGKSDIMAHLLDALDADKDIGHYGRLVFAM